MRLTGEAYYEALAQRIPEELRGRVVEELDALEMFTGPLSREDVGFLFAVWNNHIERGASKMDVNCSQCRITVLGHLRNMKKYLI